jgi:hypothetical protein
MSFLTGTQTELIYCMNPAAGQTLATFTTAALLTATASSTYAACKLPDPGATWPSGAVQKALRVVGRGTWGDTSSAPTFKMQLGFNTTQGTLGAIYAGTGTVTCPAVSVTNGAAGGAWEFELDLVFSAEGMSSGAYSYTVYPSGQFALNAPTAAAGGGITGSSASLTLLSSSTYWLELFATCAPSNASNAITCTQFMLFGMN